MVLNEELLKVIESNLPELQVNAIKKMIESKKSLEEEVENLKKAVINREDSIKDKGERLETKTLEINDLKNEIKELEALKLNESEITKRENAMKLEIEEVKRVCAEQKTEAIVNLFSIPFQNRHVKEQIFKHKKVNCSEVHSEWDGQTQRNVTTIVPKEKLEPITEEKIVSEL